MPSVSVIVLVYNSAEYLPKALRSLFGQTLEDIEYVIVDDGSTDGSMAVLKAVLEEYPDRAARVKVLSNGENLGQAASRRRGVEAASGEYIIHCDSDDWIEPEMYSKLYRKAIEGNCDMVLCHLHEVDAAGVEIRAVRDDFSTDDVPAALMGFDIHHYLLNKLVRRSAYGRMTYPVCNMWEDVAMVIQLAFNCRSFAYVEECLYHYVRRPGSLASQTPSAEKLEQMRSNVDLVGRFLKDNGSYDGYSGAYRHLKRMVKVYAQRLPRPYYMALYPEENLYLLFDRKISLAEKLGHISSMLGVHGLSDKFKKK